MEERMQIIKSAKDNRITIGIIQRIIHMSISMWILLP